MCGTVMAAALSCVTITLAHAPERLGPAVPAHAPAGAQKAPPNADAATMADFTERVRAYVALREKVKGSLPALPDDASPTQIDTHQREFAARMAKARAGARPGELFTPAMQTVVRQLLARLFRDSRSRRDLRASVMDDNPSPSQVKLAVNARYPDIVPLSTMPPDVLKHLPKLPEQVEYRFVGETLILLDPDAHIVVDYVPRALPR